MKNAKQIYPFKFEFALVRDITENTGKWQSDAAWKKYTPGKLKG